MFKSDTVDSIKRFLDFPSRAIVAALVPSINCCQNFLEARHDIYMTEFSRRIFADRISDLTGLMNLVNTELENGCNAGVYTNEEMAKLREEFDKLNAEVTNASAETSSTAQDDVDSAFEKSLSGLGTFRNSVVSQLSVLDSELETRKEKRGNLVSSKVAANKNHDSTNENREEEEESESEDEKDPLINEKSQQNGGSPHSHVFVPVHPDKDIKDPKKQLIEKYPNDVKPHIISLQKAFAKLKKTKKFQNDPSYAFQKQLAYYNALRVASTVDVGRAINSDAIKITIKKEMGSNISAFSLFPSAYYCIVYINDDSNPIAVLDERVLGDDKEMFSCEFANSKFSKTVEHVVNKNVKIDMARFKKSLQPQHKYQRSLLEEMPNSSPFFRRMFAFVEKMYDWRGPICKQADDNIHIKQSYLQVSDGTMINVYEVTPENEFSKPKRERKYICHCTGNGYGFYIDNDLNVAKEKARQYGCTIIVHNYRGLGKSAGFPHGGIFGDGASRMAQDAAEIYRKKVYENAYEDCEFYEDGASLPFIRDRVLYLTATAEGVAKKINLRYRDARIKELDQVKTLEIEQNSLELFKTKFGVYLLDEKITPNKINSLLQGPKKEEIIRFVVDCFGQREEQRNSNPLQEIEGQTCPNGMVEGFSLGGKIAIEAKRQLDDAGVPAQLHAHCTLRSIGDFLNGLLYNMFKKLGKIIETVGRRLIGAVGRNFFRLFRWYYTLDLSKDTGFKDNAVSEADILKNAMNLGLPMPTIIKIGESEGGFYLYHLNIDGLPSVEKLTNMVKKKIISLNKLAESGSMTAQISSQIAALQDITFTQLFNFDETGKLARYSRGVTGFKNKDVSLVMDLISEKHRGSIIFPHQVFTFIFTWILPILPIIKLVLHIMNYEEDMADLYKQVDPWDRSYSFGDKDALMQYQFGSLANGLARDEKMEQYKYRLQEGLRYCNKLLPANTESKLPSTESELPNKTVEYLTKKKKLFEKELERINPMSSRIVNHAHSASHENRNLANEAVYDTVKRHFERTPKQRNFLKDVYDGKFPALVHAHWVVDKLEAPTQQTTTTTTANTTQLSDEQKKDINRNQKQIVRKLMSRALKELERTKSQEKKPEEAEVGIIKQPVGSPCCQLIQEAFAEAGTNVATNLGLKRLINEKTGFWIFKQPKHFDESSKSKLQDFCQSKLQSTVPTQ